MILRNHSSGRLIAIDTLDMWRKLPHPPSRFKYYCISSFSVAMQSDSFSLHYRFYLMSKFF